MEYYSTIKRSTSEVLSRCGFNLHFSNNELCWASFHVFISHLYVFFGGIRRQRIFLKLFFCWNIIALQTFAVSCQTSTWISHRYTYIPPLWTSLLSPARPTPLGWHRAGVWVSWARQQIPIGKGFWRGRVTWICHFNLWSAHPPI